MMPENWEEACQRELDHHLPGVTLAYIAGLGVERAGYVSKWCLIPIEEAETLVALFEKDEFSFYHIVGNNVLEESPQEFISFLVPALEHRFSYLAAKTDKVT